MLRFCSLYSGSSGNSLFVQTQNTKILIDAGESAKKIVNALASINVDAKDINAILVTHEHKDHIKGLGTLSQKYNIPVYANAETWDAMPDQSIKITNENKNKFIINEECKCRLADLYENACEISCLAYKINCLDSEIDVFKTIAVYID